MKQIAYIVIILSTLLACGEKQESLFGLEGDSYRKTLSEIDSLADDYPAQARLYLNRVDSNENKAYYKLLSTKITVQQESFLVTEYKDIDDCIHEYELSGDSDYLARALYYKAKMVLLCERDTAQAISILNRVLSVNGNPKSKVAASAYNELCQMGNWEDYTKLREISQILDDTLLLARSYLYQALYEGETSFADKAFHLAQTTGNRKAIRTIYHDYIRALIEGHAPDSVIIRYLPEATTWNSPVGYFTVSRYLYDHPHPEFAKDFLLKHGTTMIEYDGVKSYWFNPNTYAMMAYMYFVALRSGNKEMADSLLRELKPIEFIYNAYENINREKEVNLMYEGGNARFRYLKVRNYIMVGIIVMLLFLLVIAVLYIWRIRRTNQIIANLTEAVRQLKDVDNPALVERCDVLSHEIDNQLRRLKHREADIADYKQQIERLESISQGLMIYSQILKNENISQIGRKGILQFLNSYHLIDDNYSQYLSELDLNPSASIFCILYHIGKTDEEVMQIMQYTLANVRTRKSRIKTDTGAVSFNDLITK